MPPIVSLNKTVLALDDSFSYSFPLKEPVYTWQQLFGVCTNFRKESMIPKEDHVILLTNESNEHNWFGSYDESLKNYFIQTNNWSYYFGNDPKCRHSPYLS
jgi:hypothetical protein